MTKTEIYIEQNWDKCIKEHTKDEGTLIGLPYPYTVPAVGTFDEMYYWDTYFINRGLLLSGREKQAGYNVDNMLFLVEKYGYMPNGNRLYYLGRSQPPLLSEMVKDLYEVRRDKDWLTGAYTVLKREYTFWMTKRGSANGLNVYGGETLLESREEIIAGFCRRTGCRRESMEQDLYRHALATYESGWDANPRWGYEAYEYAPVDLNSLLYLMEENMRYFAAELGNAEEGLWRERSQRRKKLMLSCMDCGQGILMDYHVRKRECSRVFSAASFYPLFAGLLEKENAEALVNRMPELEMEYGIAACTPCSDSGIYQWGYPNGWACLQYIIVKGLERYGKKEAAMRIAGKYMSLVERVFEQTGNLWEKYNVVQGNVQVVDEYKMPPMMGWSAGVYLEMKRYAGSKGTF